MWNKHKEAYVVWLRQAGKAQATVIAYQKDIEQFIEFLLRANKTEPAQVVAEDVEAFKDELLALRYTDKSVSRKLNSVKSFFRFLKDNDLVVGNPVQKVEHPKYEVAPPRVLTKTEYRALRDACKQDVRMSAVIELLLQTGIRISELAALRVDDISLSKKELFITPHGSHPSRVVPLNGAAIEAITQYEKVRPRSKERTFFLTKSCRPFLVRNIRSAVDRYFKIAGIKDARVNDLRHTFIVEQLAAGMPLLTVSQIVGHKRISTTERYLQFLDLDSLTSNVKIRQL